jgi:hypothetical protein
MAALAVLAFAPLVPVVESEALAQQCAFPFTIQGDRFCRDGKPVFLHMIGYQPLEPGQGLWDAIQERRIQDDLRRMRAYIGGSDPILLRVYAQPANEIPRMPKSFYDGMRELGFWIVRDIYFDEDYWANDATNRAWTNITRVVSEVLTNGATDRIFAWEIGNEFTNTLHAAELDGFLCAVVAMIKEIVAAHSTNCSQWVSWASYPPHDPLRSDLGTPVVPACLDYVSQNAYSYHPDRIRDHQPGPVTGTPYQGYLAALKDYYTNKPLVISETGLADSPSAGGNQRNWHTWHPSYTYGGLSSNQVAEGLADRYWDARLLGTIAGIGYFEWNDEWHKAGETTVHNDAPEEHFGLVRFDTSTNPPQARFKLQQETVRDMFTLRFVTNLPGFSLTVTNSSLTATGSMTIVAVLPSNRPSPIRFRWEASRGYITGNSNVAQFYAGGRALGLAKVTAIAIDANHRVWIQSTNINIETSGPPRIELLTLGTGDAAVTRASGRVENVDLDLFKLAVYIQSNSNYVQPFDDMTRIWVRPDGYWWTPVNNGSNGKLVVWLVPKSYNPFTFPTNQPPPPGALTNAVLPNANDVDNDLLPDAWETNYFGGTSYGRYDDPVDNDGANLLEEFLAGKSPTVPDNDIDGDLLWDNWERQFFGHLGFNPCDDPDGDGLANWMEFTLGLHPGRRGADCDRDGLPDLWEIRWFGCLTNNAEGDADGDGTNNLDAYELGIITASTASLPQIRLEGTNKIVLSWPTNIGHCFLDSKPDLSCCSYWTEFSQLPQVINGQFTVTLTNLTNSSFFRLWR